MIVNSEHIKIFFNRSIAILALMLLAWQPLAAQDEDLISDEDFIILSERIASFVDETTGLIDYVESAQQAQLESIHHFADIISTRWKGFMLLEQEVISQDDSLMVLVSYYEQSMKMLTDSIASREKTLLLHSNFVKAEKFIASQKDVYEKMYEKVELLVLTPKTAAQLEEHKTREQLLFAEIQQHYNNAREAVQRDPKLKKRMDALEENYVQIKTLSDKIQEAAYKSLFDRVKEYLLSLACVAILLMFLNIIAVRIKAMKQARKAAMDMKKMMEQQNNEIPTI